MLNLWLLFGIYCYEKLNYWITNNKKYVLKRHLKTHLNFIPGHPSRKTVAEDKSYQHLGMEMGGKAEGKISHPWLL